MDGLSLDNPWDWERLRLGTDEQELIAFLRQQTSEIGQIRLAEMLLALVTPAGLNEALDILDGRRHPLAQALLIGGLMRHKLWRQCYEIAKNWNHPLGGTPLLQEANYVMSIFGAMAAFEVQDSALANRLLGRAEILHFELKLTIREFMLEGEIQRVNNINGKGNPDAVRAVRAKATRPRQYQHSTHTLAETLAGRGEYAQAIAELTDTDPRSVGMRAFYRTIMNEPFLDPGTDDDYLRLARTLARHRQGIFETIDIDCKHDPQLTYSRLLTMEALTHSPLADRRYAGLQLPIPQIHDQQVWWVLNRLGALSKGIVVPEAHLIYDVWDNALAGLTTVRSSLDDTRLLHLGERLLVLAALPDAPDQLLRTRQRLPVLTGETIVYQGEELNASGRIGSVLIARAIHPDLPVLDPLRGNEPARWKRRVQELTKSGQIPHAPINPGASLRAAIGIRDARLALNLDTARAEHVITRLLTELSVDCRTLLYPYVRGGDYEKTLTDGTDAGFDPGPRLACRPGRALPGVPHRAHAAAYPPSAPNPAD